MTGPAGAAMATSDTPRPDLPARERAAEHHNRRWGSPALVSRAPGRVNLIGEHTDYNDGFVLPMALPFDAAVAASHAPGGCGVEIHAEGFGSVEFDPADPIDAGDWSVHLRGVCRLLTEQGVNPGPWRAAMASDIPAGASLSSSAALEVAVALAVLGLAGLEWSPQAIAKLGQRVENEVVGVPSGIMDQLISATAVAGHASLIDCRSLRATPVPIPDGAVVAVMDTSTRRQLVSSAYADRRDSCSRAASALGLASLRDAQLAHLARLPTSLGVEQRRARHVITENQRTLDAAQAMSDGNARALGHLMDASHVSLRDDYEVSGPALDQIVDIARTSPGCLGARMPGGGFAGCAVALVSAERADDFCTLIVDQFRNASGLEATIWLCEPAAGGST